MVLRKIAVSILVVIVILLAGAYASQDMWHVPTYEQHGRAEPPLSASLPADAEWLSLFNGKNLQGWVPKITGHPLGRNFANTYRVEDGAITVSYDQYDTFDYVFGNLFYQQPFSHYILRLDYRFRGEQATDAATMGWAWRNSGVMVHSQEPASMTMEQWFPASIEVQLLGAREGQQRSTGNLCTPATHVLLYGKLHTAHCTDSASKSYPGDQWVQLEVEVRGSERIRHFINGELVLDYTQPQLDPADTDAQPLLAARPAGDTLLTQGYIALQSESHPLQFRNIELFVLE